MAKKGSKKAAQKAGEALVSKVYTEEKTGLVRLNLNAFEPEDRNKIVSIMRQVSSDVSAIARSYLTIGKTLYEAQKFLEEKGDRVFTAFVNEIPGMNYNTAHRYILAWEHAQNIFPEKILSRILAANLPMIGGPDQRFGRYTEAIKKNKLDKQLAEAIEKGEVSDEFADNWIKAVQAAQSKAHGARKAKTPDPSSLQQEAFQAVRRRWKRLPEGKQTTAWLTNLFGYLLDAAGFASPATVQPRKAPKDWENETTQSTKEEQKTKEEGKASA